MNNDTKNAETLNSKGFITGASSAVAPVQVVQNSGAKVVQNDDQKIAPKIAPVAPVQGSILNITISGFASYSDTEPVDVNLLKWLTSDKHADRVNAIRQTTNKADRDRMKALLPAITPSGIFSKREAAGLIRHSGLIQFDVDAAKDIQTTKQKITSLANVAYCGLSVSGRGLWGLIPISEPEHHKEYFIFIEKAFASMGIIIDPACKDVCRLRGYSYDPDAYFNHSAKPLQKWYKPQKPNAHKHHFQPVYGDEVQNKVEHCLNEVQAKNIDLTPNYEQWFKLGCALANEFGEYGRNYFHTVSQFHPEYNQQQTNKQFTYCLKHRYGVTIASFFAACKGAGIMFKKFAPVQNGISETRYQSGSNWCNFSGSIGVAPVAPVPDTPTWYVDMQGILRQYQAGEITGDQFFDRQDRNREQSGLTPEEYVKKVNKLATNKTNTQTNK